MAGNTILVIDGDPASRNYVRAALEKEGHRVLEAGSGKEGLIAAWRDRPELIIAEPALTDLPGEQFAARLRSDPRTAKLPLLALSRDGSPSRAVTCRQAGFTDFVVKGPQAIPSLLASITLLLHGGQGAAKQGGLLVVFLSAKGGTGTSCLCANLATSMATERPEASVVVADLVLPIGSIAGIVGYSDPQNLATLAAMPPAQTTPDFLRNQLPLIEAWRFHLLAGAPDPQSGNELAVMRISELVAGLQAAYDYVLLDLGRSLSRISLPLIEHADLTVLVAGADVSTVNLTRTVWHYLESKGLLQASVFAILNRAVGLEGLTRAEIEKILDIPIKTSIPYLGGNFSLANNQHQPFTVKFPMDTASIALKDTARQIMTTAQKVRAG